MPIASILSLARHWGLIGLFAIGVLDGSPIPAFGSADIVLAILAATHRSPWFVYAITATIASTLGACITFRVARKAGEAWVHSKFGKGKVAAFFDAFKRQGTGTLVAATAIPFPLPTTVVFAAAGASDYRLEKFILVVAASRAFRYSLVALLVDHYGRQVIRIIRHPTQHLSLLLLLLAVVAAVVAVGLLANRRLTRHA